MKLHDQICTIEQAKRLKELGVAEKSYFVFLVFKDTVEHTGPRWAYVGDKRIQIPSFTVAELGVMLPDYFSVHRGHSGGYYCNKLMSTDPEAIGPTMAQAMASRLITGLETGEFTAEEVNKRLST